MKRTTVTRWQLVILLLLLVLVVARVAKGPARPDGMVVLDDLSARELADESFSLARPLRVVVEAVGSFEQAGQPAAGLAAYGWIVRRDTRAVVWQMNAARAGAGHGTLATVTDTLTLGPGGYDVYFTTYGNTPRDEAVRTSWLRRFVDPQRRWEGDRRRWLLTLRPLDADAPPVEPLETPDEAERRLTPSGTLWTSGALSDDARADYVFEVRRPARLLVYAAGEIKADQREDYGWIEDAVTGRRLWEMTLANTRPAGGAAANRSFRDVLTLPAGIYRAGYVTNGSHSPDRWLVNPPLDPTAWGLSLSVADPTAAGAVTAFDPWRSRRPIVDITNVPADNLRFQQFIVDAPSRLIVHAEGEITESGRYDFAWIESNAADGPVWEMQRDASEPAGGGEKNRRQTAFVALAPGTYTVYYQTDDSHGPGDWNTDPPEHPERWGVTLFPLAPEGAPVRLLGNVQVQANDKNFDMADASAPVPPVVPPPGDLVVDELTLGNDTRLDLPFTLERPALVHLYAVGEITLRGRFDYGWIDRKGTDETVWEMTWQNTEPAGGHERNRRFFGTVKLPAGEYVAHFRTDASHAHGDFGDQAPTGEDWGLRITRMLPGAEAPQHVPTPPPPPPAP